VFRAFWQGYSKRLMQLLYPGQQAAEAAFVGGVITEAVPRRIWRAISGRSARPLAQIGAIGSFALAIAAGYLWGVLWAGR
jgi:hypothetical protein